MASRIQSLISLAKSVATVGVLGYGVSHSYFDVDGGERAIVFNRVTGIKDHVYSEGTHLLVPWLEWPYIYNIQSVPYEVASKSGSKDLQMVDISLRVLTRPIPEELPKIYRSLGFNFAERVLNSLVQETLKSVIARYNASQLLVMREDVSLEINRVLSERARSFGIEFEDISITELEFGRDFRRAVENKQVAQQDAERAKYVVEKAKRDKEQAVVRAKGEAESALLIGKSVQQNPAFLTLRKIEAAKEVSRSLARAQNKVFLNSDSLLLNLAELDTGVPKTSRK